MTKKDIIKKNTTGYRFTILTKDAENMMDEWGRHCWAEDMKKLLYTIEMHSKEIIDIQTGIRHLVVDWSFVEAQFKALGIEIEHPF